MFTTNHFIWLAICAVFLAALIVAMIKLKPTEKQALTFACILAAASEITKTLARVEILPTSSGGYTAFIDPSQIPLHLCSIQVFFIFAVRFLKKGKIRDTLLAFMYPTCIVSPLFSLAIPTVFSTTDVSSAFTNVMPYQYFLYHTMLIGLGIYIAKSGIVQFRFKHIISSVVLMFVLAYIAIYANSALSTVDYSTGSAIVEDVVNFFFVYGLPKAVKLFTITEKWQWLLYFFCLIALVTAIFTLMFLPFILHNRKKEKEKNNLYDKEIN